MTPAMLRYMLFCLALAVPPVTGAMFRIWVHQEAVQLGYALSEQEKERQRLDALERQLEVERAALLSPDNMQRLARELGLRAPTAQEVWRLASAPVRGAL
ncbi:MAG: hypothetical protein AAB426_04170 [Myxococcota bacterium]